MAETRACFCIVCLPVVLPVATRAEKIWANLILLGYRLQWAHRPSRDDDGAIEACLGVGRRGRGPEHVAAHHAGLGRSLIQVLAFRPAHGLVAAQATPGGAMEVPWRCHGGAMEVPWRCHGGAVEVPWRCRGGAVEGRGRDRRPQHVLSIFSSPTTSKYSFPSFSFVVTLYQPQEVRGRGWNTARRRQESRRKALLATRKELVVSSPAPGAWSCGDSALQTRNR